MTKLNGKRKKKVEVCCCILIYENKILILKRNHMGPRNGLWEFPGGKIENETPIDCTKRELKEEINIEINNIKYLCKVKKEYEDIFISLTSFISFLDSVFTPSLKVHSEFRWIASSELHKFSFPEANREIIDILIKSGY